MYDWAPSAFCFCFTGCRNPAHTYCSSPSKKIDIDSPVTFGPVSKVLCPPADAHHAVPKNTQYTEYILYYICALQYRHWWKSEISKSLRCRCGETKARQATSSVPSSDGSVTLVWLMGSKHHWSRHWFKRASCQVLCLQRTHTRTPNQLHYDCVLTALQNMAYV